MKKISKYLFIILVSNACTKKKEIIGRIYNPVTQTPLAGVGYEIAKWKSSGLSAWGPSEKKIAKSGTTDNNGRFSVTKWISKNSAYSFKINMPDNYYPSISSMKLDQLEKKNEIDFLVARTGKINLNLKNLNCFNVDDKLTLIQTHDYFIIENIEDNDTIVINGCFDWSRLKKNQPEGYHYFKSKLLRNGQETISNHIIYVYPDSTTELSINY